MTAPPLDPTGADRRLRLVLATAPAEAAERLARGAVRGRLAACVSTGPLRSVYWWKGRIESAEEVLLLCKTSPKKLGALTEYLARHHPYEVPEILEVQVSRVHEPYIRWLFEAIDPGSAEPPRPRVRRAGSPRARGAPSPRRTRAPRRRRY